MPESLQLAIRLVYGWGSLFAFAYYLKYGASKKLCATFIVLTCFILAYDAWKWIDTGMFRLYGIPVDCLILASWIYDFFKSDDDDDDFKRDVEKVKRRIVITSTGLKVVPVKS